jgi:hypothetical protein
MGCLVFFSQRVLQCRMTGSKAALYVHRLSEWKSCGARAANTHYVSYIMLWSIYKRPVCFVRVCEPPPQRKINNEICILCTWSRSGPTDWLLLRHICVYICISLSRAPCGGILIVSTHARGPHKIYIIMNVDVFHDLSWHAFVVLIFYYPTPCAADFKVYAHNRGGGWLLYMGCSKCHTHNMLSALTSKSVKCMQHQKASMESGVPTLKK